MRNSIWAVVFLTAIGCGGGGGSGISGSVVLSDLTQEDLVALCEEFADDYPVREITCGTETIEIGVDPAECEGEQEAFTCDATVGEFRTCFATLYGLSDEDYCNLTALPAECEPIEPCLQ
jgi:hypothetical protein